MTSNATACPFCNGVLPPLSAAPTVAKLPCPRCGELVPAPRWLVDTAIVSGEPKIKFAATQPSGPGTRKTAAIVVSVMLVMAIIGLSYAFWTTELRRSRHPKMSLDPVTIRRPLELDGLRYLPKDSHVIVGLHIAEWLADKKVGKPLLEEPRPIYLDMVVKQLPRVTGMPLEELDQVVLTVVATRLDNPQLVAVVKTRRPYSLEKIVESVRPTNSVLHQKLPLYTFSTKPFGEAVLWCIEEKTLICVVGQRPIVGEDLRGLSATPRKLEEVLSPPIHEAMKERLPRQPFLWVVVPQSSASTMATIFFPDSKLGLNEIKTVAFALEPIEGLTLTGHLHANDAKSAGKLKTFLDNVKIDGATSQKVVAPAPDQEPWLTWQVRGDVGAMRNLMSLGKDAKK